MPSHNEEERKKRRQEGTLRFTGDPGKVGTAFDAEGGTTDTGATSASRRVQRQSEIDRVRRNRALTELEQARTSALSGLEQRERQLAPTFQAERAGLSGASQVRARNLAEYLANRGVTRSGATLQGALARTGQLGTQLAGSQQRETQARQDIAQERADIGREFGLRRLGAFSKLEEQELLGQQQLERDLTSLADRERAIARQTKADEFEDIQREVALSAGDYAQAMQDYLAEGGSPSDPRYRALQTARAEKIREQELREVQATTTELQQEKLRVDIDKIEASVADPEPSTDRRIKDLAEDILLKNSGPNVIVKMEPEEALRQATILIKGEAPAVVTQPGQLTPSGRETFRNLLGDYDFLK